ncbi:LOW QUALITY PROTEIN: hypothetical protein HID58_077982 [Brassica napus]|uniref:Disease resistance protein Roq1-like winged-helix domain-containing protein n=1 Tax=Brassica napus TaxID=3708 RepID=A0ABQ7YTN5_BRANA|nr:LOW QUALITY PROTEIN: hypothetical protein HID58_077982 [Brassica napus]
MARLSSMGGGFFRRRRVGGDLTRRGCGSVDPEATEPVLPSDPIILGLRVDLASAEPTVEFYEKNDEAAARMKLPEKIDLFAVKFQSPDGVNVLCRFVQLHKKRNCSTNLCTKLTDPFSTTTQMDLSIFLNMVAAAIGFFFILRKIRSHQENKEFDLDDEASMVEEIATNVSNDLINFVISSDFEGFAGMEAHMKKMEPFLLLGSNEVRIIGIWGPSGIGKSTIARVLFSQHSHEFQLSVFMENIKRQFAGNLPLGLKVMGSYFKGMLKHEWEEELPRLSARLDGEIESSLKLRYDALSVDTQDLFLHLACFFNNERIEKVEEYLARNIVGVKGQLRVLAEKSFISIVGGYIKIHDLLARLGREIVRKQSIHEPGQRQFLADVGDICQVLQNDTLGSRSVIGIDLKLLELETELKISERAFERMSNVQFLRLLLSDSDSDSGSDYGRPKQTCHHSIDLMTCLPPNLKLLHWDFFPMTCLPSNFISEFLVEIALRKSNYLEKLWEGNKTIRNLKWMYLSDSKNLKELPDLSTATSLQELNLHGCSNLAELPFSIGNVISLRRLNLSHCSSLVRIPSFIWNLINLGRLDISHCSSLVRLPSSSGNAIIKLKELNLTGCLRLAKLPSSIGNLKKLYLKDCSSLVELPSSVRNSINLKDFTFNGCSNLVELPFYLGNATDLKKIDLSGCSSLQELPSSIGNMTNLMHLYLDECSSLLELPSSIGNMTSLLYLYLNECSSLVELPSSIGNINNLMKLHLNGCSSLVELPSSIGNMNNLGNLYLNGCSSLVELPSSIGNINHLRKLSLNGCSSLVELPSSIGHMNHLRKLYLERCSKLRALPININMKSLGKLFLTDCSSLKCVPEISTNISVLKLTGTSIEELPRSIMSWPRLRELHLSDTRIQEIAPWVKERSSLRELVIKGCTKLVSLPQLPDSLKFLVADNCGSLERLDCSFYKTKFHGLSFVNCFGLNQEAREIIINTWTRDFAIFPGETVPTYFNYRATRSSLSMTWNGLDTQYFPTSLRFKACLLLVYKGDVDADDWCWPDISYCIKDKLNSEHLLVFKIEEKVGSPELAFEFRSHDKIGRLRNAGYVLWKVGNNCFGILGSLISVSVSRRSMDFNGCHNALFRHCAFYLPQSLSQSTESTLYVALFNKSIFVSLIAPQIKLIDPFLQHTNGFLSFLNIVAAALGFFLIFRKLRSHHENEESDSSSLFPSFLKEIKKQRKIVEKRKKRKPDELSNPIAKPVRKKIRLQNQSQTQVPSSPQSSLSPSSPPSPGSPSSPPSLSSPSPPQSSLVDEAAMIEDISTDVFNKLNNSAQSSDFDTISTHMIKLKLLLRLGSNEVRMIGFWGPSGIGKSTIARVLFSQYSREFQFSVFMENIKRRFGRPYYDEYSAKLQLQKEFIEIVRKQSIREPGQRQFLVDAGDICQVLRNDTLGSRNVIGIDLDFSKSETRPYPHHRPHDMSAPKSKNFALDYFPLTCLPSNFNPEFLTIRNLKLMNLTDSENLKELPDLSTATNLQTLNLFGCSSLTEIPFSIGNAINLRHLDLTNCSGLVEFPSSMENVTTLEELLLTGCSHLANLPPFSLCIFPSRNLNCEDAQVYGSSLLLKLYLESCSNLTALPININMKSLDELVLTDCSSLKIFPEISTNISVLKLAGTAIEELPPSIMSWPHLRELTIKGCTKLTQQLWVPRKTRLLRFVNCFKLNQEARDLIITHGQRLLQLCLGNSAYIFHVPSHREFPVNELEWIDAHYFPTSLRFKVCLLLVYKGDAGYGRCPEISYCINDKLNGVKPAGYSSYRLGDFYPTLGEHLFIFEIEGTVSAPELVFEFGNNQQQKLGY